MLQEKVDQVIDKVSNRFNVKSDVKLIPRKFVRWSIYLVALASIEFLIASVVAAVQTQWIVTAKIFSLALASWGFYLISLGGYNLMLYVAQSQSDNILCKRPFWRTLHSIYRAMAVFGIFAVGIIANYGGILAIVYCLLGRGDEIWR